MYNDIFFKNLLTLFNASWIYFLFFVDKVARWTQNKLCNRSISGFESVIIEEEDILRMTYLWFISWLVSVPSIDMYSKLGLANDLSTKSRSEGFKQPSWSTYAQPTYCYSPVEQPCLPWRKIHTYIKRDFLYLIFPLFTLT